MPRKRSNGSGIPAWFDLKNYSYLRDLGASGWAKVLLDLNFISDCTPEEFFEYDDGSEDKITSANGAFSDLLVGAPSGHGDGIFGQFRDKPSSFKFGGVSSLDNFVVARMGATLSLISPGDQVIEAMRDVVQAENGDIERIPKRSRETLHTNKKFLDKPYFTTLRETNFTSDSGSSLTPNRAISVSTNLPDEILVEDFKRWLRSMRELQFHPAAQRAFTPNDYSKWIDHGYVPLLLLTSWSRITGVSITLAELARRAFPANAYVTEDNVRRTYLPRAKEWAVKETLNALAAQAAREGGHAPTHKNPGDAKYRQRRDG